MKIAEKTRATGEEMLASSVGDDFFRLVLKLILMFFETRRQIQRSNIIWLLAVLRGYSIDVHLRKTC